FKPEMGWTGKSWLLTSLLGEGAVGLTAAIFYLLSALGLVIGGAGLLGNQLWFRPVLIWSSVLSLLTILIFWDGSSAQMIEKGFLGFLINMLVIAGLLLFNWPQSIP
ncbi:MAG: hypothetical protein HQ574_08650, partial [Chloroflexi bacterium]|nr:hypothetical protein [Chloroflexota bacterium]